MSLRSFEAYLESKNFHNFAFFHNKSRTDRLIDYKNNSLLQPQRNNSRAVCNNNNSPASTCQKVTGSKVAAAYTS